MGDGLLNYYIRDMDGKKYFQVQAKDEKEAYEKINEEILVIIKKDNKKNRSDKKNKKIEDE